MNKNAVNPIGSDTVYNKHYKLLDTCKTVLKELTAQQKMVDEWNDRPGVGQVMGYKIGPGWGLVALLQDAITNAEGQDETGESPSQDDRKDE